MRLTQLKTRKYWRFFLAAVLLILLQNFLFYSQNNSYAAFLLLFCLMLLIFTVLALLGYGNRRVDAAGLAVEVKKMLLNSRVTASAANFFTALFLFPLLLAALVALVFYAENTAAQTGHKILLLLLFLISLLLLARTGSAAVRWRELIINYSRRSPKVVALFVITVSCFLPLLFYYSWREKIIASDFIFYQVNAIQKISATLIFYFLFVILLYAMGGGILRRFKINFSFRAEEFLFSLAAGTVPLILATYFLLLGGWLFRPVAWAVMFFLLFANRREIKSIIKELSRLDLRRRLKDYSRWKIIGVGAMLCLLLINFLGVFKPSPRSTDDLSTYWNAPYLYATVYHQYRPLNHLPEANMAQNTEMIYAFIIALAGSAYIAHVQFLFFVLLLIGIYYLFKNLFGDKLALLSTLAVFLMPWNIYYFNVAKVEFFLSFTSLLIVYSLFLFYQNHDKKYLLLMGVLSGLAAGIKYNALFIVIPCFALALFLILFKRSGLYKNTANWLLAACLAVLFFSPWGIKNIYYFNNPFYPYEIVFKNYEAGVFTENYAYKKARNEEIKRLRYGVPTSANPLFRAIRALDNQASARNIEKGLWINIGFISPLILLLAFFVYKNKYFTSLLILTLSYFSLWYIADGARGWYAFFGYILLYAFIPLLFYRYRFVIFGFFLLLALISFQNYPFFFYGLGYLADQTGLKNTAASLPYHQTADYLNKIPLTGQNRVLIAGDLMAGFIDYNDRTTVLDLYLSKTGYYLNQGEENFLKTLNEAGLEYIIYSDTIDNLQKVWLKKKNVSLQEYLAGYQGDVPSLLSDLNKLRSFLSKYAEPVGDGDFYHLYKINKI